MLTRKFLYIACALLAFSTFSYSQVGYDESAVDSSWIASQNNGNLDLNDGNVDEPTPACVGDGCDGTEVYQPVESATSEDNQVTDSASSETNAETSSESSCEGENCNSVPAADSAVVASIAAEEYEDCTEADSTNVDCVEVEEEESIYDKYVEENAEQYRARKEGFSRSIQLGVRATGGINTLFGKKQEGWGIGYQFGGGIMVKMPIGIRHMSLVPELDFVYRHYSFEKDNDYSSNEAGIDYMLFEIPVILRYTIDEDNLFFGLGLNIDLKLTGSSEFNQKVFETGETDKRRNSLPTSGVELGGVFNVGYAITRQFVVDLRVLQAFTNLLNEDSIAESSLTHAKLMTFYTTLGFTFVF